MDEDDLPDLDHLLRNPTGWVEDPAFFPILIPPAERVDITLGPMSGFEIRGDDVFIIEEGRRRKAEGAEAFRVRRDFISAMGDDIARIVGLEPE